MGANGLGADLGYSPESNLRTHGSPLNQRSGDDVQCRRRWQCCWLSGSDGQEFPLEIQEDRLLVQAEREMRDGEHGGANGACDEGRSQALVGFFGGPGLRT